MRNAQKNGIQNTRGLLCKRYPDQPISRRRFHLRNGFSIAAVGCQALPFITDVRLLIINYSSDATISAGPPAQCSQLQAIPLAPSNGMDAESSAAVPLSSPAAAQRGAPDLMFIE